MENALVRSPSTSTPRNMADKARWAQELGVLQQGLGSLVFSDETGEESVFLVLRDTPPNRWTIVLEIWTIRTSSLEVFAIFLK